MASSKEDPEAEAKRELREAEVELVELRSRLEDFGGTRFDFWRLTVASWLIRSAKQIAPWLDVKPGKPDSDGG